MQLSAELAWVLANLCNGRRQRLGSRAWRLIYHFGEARAKVVDAQAAGPEELLALLQATQGLRRGETGQAEVIVGGASIPLVDHLANLRSDPRWQHHFSASGQRGMGAAPSGSSVVPGMTNPWRKDTFNWTQQLMLEQQNPELAETFKREAARG